MADSIIYRLAEEVPKIELVPTWQDRLNNLAFGWQATVIGIVMVFLILGILIGFITLTHLVIKFSTERRLKNSCDVAVPARVQTEDAGSLTAAITAAVSILLEREAEESGEEPIDFVVTNIKRIR